MIIAETERLILREMTIDDAESLYLLNADPDVIQYTGDYSFKDIKEARKYLENYDHYQKHGYGRWGLINKNSMDFLGWCGLKYHEQEKLNDIGFRLMKKYWNQGFASEAALKCLNLGFMRFQMPFIAAHADIRNLSSIRVLNKIGLIFQKHYYENERKCAAYKIAKDRYDLLYNN